jgi:hypothetical protein
MSKVIIAVLKKILISLFAEKVLMAVFIGLGDWLVKSTENTLDDKVMAIVKEKLEETNE